MFEKLLTHIPNHKTQVRDVHDLIIEKNLLKMPIESLKIFHLTTQRPRIEKEGLTEKAIILCKLNKSLLESSLSVGIHWQKSLYYLMNLCI